MKRLGALVLGAAAVAAPMEAADAAWPQWLGPTRDGRAAEGALRNRTAPKLAVAWRKALGAGASGVVAAEGRAYTLFSDGESDFAVALQLADGREVWRTRLDASLPNSERGPLSTPLLAGSLLVTLSPTCQLRALEAATGKPAWHRDLKADFGVTLRQGCATAPLLEKEQVLVQGGGRENDNRLMAFDLASGRTAWSAKGPERVTYTSPVVGEIGGVRQAVVHTTQLGPPPVSTLLGLKLDDQSVLWTASLEKGFSFDTPVLLPEGRVGLGTWTDFHVLAVAAREGKLQAARAWRSEDLSANVSPPVYSGGHLYGFAGDFLACVDAANGRTVWKEKIYPGSVALADGHLVALSVTAGAVRLVEATPAGYREKAKLEVLTRGARAETPPSIAGGHVLVRNEEEVVALRLE